MVKQPAAKTLTETQAEALSELRFRLMPEVNLGNLAGRVMLRPRLGGQVSASGRLAGEIDCKSRLGGATRMP